MVTFEVHTVLLVKFICLVLYNESIECGIFGEGSQIFYNLACDSDFRY